MSIRKMILRCDFFLYIEEGDKIMTETLGSKILSPDF